MKAPDENAPSLSPEIENDDRSTHTHRQLIGVIGMLLPALLWLIVGWRPIDELHPWKPLNSISAYYYTGAVTAFAGCLIALALFLFSYRGYDNEYGHRDRVAAIIAGGAAVLVAFFPTEADKVALIPSWWTRQMGWIHFSSATILLGSFIFFSLFQFPKSKSEKANLPPDKQVRNCIYIFCGAAILVCMVWAVSAKNNKQPIFWPETLALEFFAMSWLVKGRADQTAVAASTKALYYGRNPRQLVDIARSAIRGKRGAEPIAPQSDD